jgi:hypothetical protein
MYTTNAIINVQCERSQVNNCHTVPTTGEFDKRDNYCFIVKEAKSETVILFPRLIYLKNAINIVHCERDYFNYFGSMIANDERCTREIKSRIVMAKAEFNKKKTVFTRNWTYS